jgi:site-specific recombinase XerD
MSEAPDNRGGGNGRDAIERFLDRNWMMEHTSIPTLSRQRFALVNLDFWMQRRRRVSLTTATARDVRALLDSSHWDAVSLGCESLLSLVTALFQNLQETRFRSDDPIITIIDQEIAAAAKHASSRPARRQKRSLATGFHLSTVTG